MNATTVGSRSGYTLGIDVGTTYTAAAIRRGDVSEMLTLGASSTTIPSIVLLRADGDILTGDAAERRAVTEPTRVAREFKRRVGDSTPIIVGGTPYGAEALVAHMIKTVIDAATTVEGSPPARVVLTHPASWGEFKIDLLRQAARLAGAVGDGPDGLVVVTEPEAAALHYVSQERIEPGQIIGVYDLGGGTFDAALLRRTVDGFEVLGVPEGMERFGGIDIDRAMMAHVDDALGGMLTSEATTPDAATASAIARLRDDVRLAKENLSSDSDATIPVLLPGLNTEVRVTRADLEGMIRPRLHETIDALRRCARSAGLDFDDLHAILAVGGSSRIPLVREMIREVTDRPVVVDAHPKHAIALGAASIARSDDPDTTTAVAADTIALPLAGPSVVAASSTAPGDTNRRPPWRWVAAGVGAFAVAAVAVLVLSGGGSGDADSVATASANTLATTQPTTGDSTEAAPGTTVEAPTTSEARVDDTTATDTTPTDTTPTDTATPTSLAPTPPVDETVEVVDGTGTFAVTLPMQFTTNVQPVNIGGVDFAHVSGAEDLGRYLSGDWTALGVSVFVTANSAGSAATLAPIFDPLGACTTSSGPQPYTSSIGSGVLYEFDGCGTGPWSQSVLAVDVPAQGAVVIFGGQGPGPAAPGLTEWFGLMLSSVRAV
jgi:actin-like ATPase involved in cell morphogenesis